ncbi:MAG: hypothetical protein ACI4V5_08075 [Prevotella sp.]
MKKLLLAVTVLIMASCGSKQEKSAEASDNSDTVETSNETGSPLMGGIPELYGETFEKLEVLQEQIQLAYKNGGSPSESLVKDFTNVQKEAKEKAEQLAPSVINTDIPVEGYDYGYVNITSAKITDVNISNTSGLAKYEISFFPAEGSDFKNVPRGSAVYYLCLTSDNKLLFINAMHFPSSAKTAIHIGFNATGRKKVSPAVWKDFAKIKFVSEADYKAIISRR